MAEYYPLLAKAVGSLPNSTPETRRVVYERARKALIGQLRTLHPPVPDDDIERESLELDRAVERLEGELANGTFAPAATAAPAVNSPASAVPPSSPASTPALRPPQTRPLQTRGAKAAPDATPPAVIPPLVPADVLPAGGAPADPPAKATLENETGAKEAADQTAAAVKPAAEDAVVRPRLDTQRPIAPAPPVSKTARRRIWIVPAALAVVVALVAVAAWKLRDNRETVARTKPAEQQASTEGSKIAERVGGASSDKTSDQAAPVAAGASAASPATSTGGSAADQTAQGQSATPGNDAPPDVPVAQRAALLVEAPSEESKVKTFLGRVVWKLNNTTSTGANDAVGLGVEADIDIPDDKMKASVVFEKNTDPSLPASHTINVRFTIQPGSFTGDVQKISVPQLRAESVSSGDALVGVTVPIVPNSFLVGLAPGSTEASNLKLLKDLQWIDIPILLSNGKIAKLTFEKGAAGQRYFDEAIAAWQKS